MEGRDEVDARGGAELNGLSWREGDAEGDAGDFLSIDQDPAAGTQNGATDNMFMLFNLEGEAAVENAPMEYDTIDNDVGNNVDNDVDDVDNVNLMLQDVAEAAPDSFHPTAFQNGGNWTQLEPLGPDFEANSLPFNGGTGSAASTSNAAGMEWSTSNAGATATNAGPHANAAAAVALGPANTGSAVGMVGQAPSTIQMASTGVAADMGPRARNADIDVKAEPMKTEPDIVQPSTPVDKSTHPTSPSSSSLKRKRSGKGGVSTTSGNTVGVKPKSTVTTAKCPLCHRETATNGANFKRHKEACMRQKGLISPSGAPLHSSAVRPPDTVPPADAIMSPAVATSTPAIQHQTQQANTGKLNSSPQVATQLEARQHVDEDLSNRIRRLEDVISTMNVPARICLRDSLISLSNKAANPNVLRTPEQEEMNRAAEYLVLRMLFSSEPPMQRRPAETSEPQ
mmetsp:Transcript_5284/g.15783  ORF Transcript_5284/g.15783 Transcript_5284/m.15783 type:complete len:454 (-) Transcript_5284:1864-3225(-)|eukprot:CAMPEP_0198723940 /NCGR_PEP_ID=MMETSP1475-20131203/1451_1 /TAXON_ID= ORGANISM="Unidentified sp., Strain CCMP1999" /NCGR_SAMPLE_ID=MMETSP1475 /ASSEMBLY_ACC=CAM_ASM_001111 /LENGTH=453 /DNA_ID=CAMNT_0044485281 /DNA_START=91 /DNA_END=1452 /DNA_ORIENTATION=-